MESLGVFKNIIFIYLRERTGARGNGGEKEKQAPHWAESPTWGSIPGLWDHDLSQRQTLNGLCHTGANYLILNHLNILSYLEILSWPLFIHLPDSIREMKSLPLKNTSSYEWMLLKGSSFAALIDAQPIQYLVLSRDGSHVCHLIASNWLRFPG